MSTSADEFDYASTTVPDAALFVAADEPLLVFPSATAAEQYLEAIDVENGVYPVAFGPRGEPYRVGTNGDQVVIERTGEPERPGELRSLLLRYLEGSRRLADPATSLEALVAEVWKTESDFWQEHDLYGERFGSRIPLWGCLASILVLATALYLILG
ncbi:MAG TPA: hypothetical protein VF589_10470 [Allosphingosinicella sp.]